MELLDLLIRPALAQAASEALAPFFAVDIVLVVAIVALFKVFARWPRYERWLVVGSLVVFALYVSFQPLLFWLIPILLLGLWIYLRFNTSLLAVPVPALGASTPTRNRGGSTTHQTAPKTTPVERKSAPAASRKPDPDPWPPTVSAAAVIEKIFLSYRRDDSADASGRIYDRLVQRFGKEQIFKDVDSIPLGVDFREHLDSVVGRCSLVLVVIGDRWISAGAAGARRLDDVADFVRIEIESALARKIPVVPVLVRGAAIPAETELPQSLRSLAYRHGIAVRADPDFHRDMDRLIAGLEAHLTRIPATIERH